MGGKLNALALVLVAAATLLHGSAAQTKYTVGDTLGWTIPPRSASTYSTWASNKTFKVGDTLVFNFDTGVTGLHNVAQVTKTAFDAFDTGQHNVAQVTKTAFDACDTASPTSTVITSPASIKLNETGSHYFICAVGTHCSLGQKLAVNVSGASSPSPSPSPSSATPPSASPPAPSLSTPSTPSLSNSPPPRISTTAPAPGGGMSRATLIGLVTGTLLGGLLIFVGICTFCYRRRKWRRLRRNPSPRGKLCLRIYPYVSILKYGVCAFVVACTKLHVRV